MQGHSPQSEFPSSGIQPSKGVPFFLLPPSSASLLLHVNFHHHDVRCISLLQQGRIFADLMRLSLDLPLCTVLSLLCLCCGVCACTRAYMRVRACVCVHPRACVCMRVLIIELVYSLSLQRREVGCHEVDTPKAIPAAAREAKCGGRKCRSKGCNCGLMK